MKIGWRQAAGPTADRLLLLLLLALYLHFFPRAPRRRHVYFSSFFFFSGNRRALPPHICDTATANYAMSTSGRTFKLALIKYWLRVVFFINRWFFRSTQYCINLNQRFFWNTLRELNYKNVIIWIQFRRACKIFFFFCQFFIQMWISVWFTFIIS